jgi:hypothetical protein
VCVRACARRAFGALDRLAAVGLQCSVQIAAKWVLFMASFSHVIGCTLHISPLYFCGLPVCTGLTVHLSRFITFKSRMLLIIHRLTFT